VRTGAVWQQTTVTSRLSNLKVAMIGSPIQSGSGSWSGVGVNGRRATDQAVAVGLEARLEDLARVFGAEEGFDGGCVRRADLLQGDDVGVEGADGGDACGLVLVDPKQVVGGDAQGWAGRNGAPSHCQRGNWRSPEVQAGERYEDAGCSQSGIASCGRNDEDCGGWQEEEVA
jgi:hypothetical protein